MQHQQEAIVPGDAARSNLPHKVARLPGERHGLFCEMTTHQTRVTEVIRLLDSSVIRTLRLSTRVARLFVLFKNRNSLGRTTAHRNRLHGAFRTAVAGHPFRRCVQREH